MVGKTYWGGVTGLIDTSTNESGYIDSSGVEQADTKMTRTALIPVKYDTYVVKAIVPTSGWNIRVNGYDENGAWVSVLLTFTGKPEYQEKKFSIPNGVSYVRLSYHGSGLESVGLFRKI